MGRLPWRGKWSVLGCRRGWARLAAFALFVTLAGYFGFYAILRVNDKIKLEVWTFFTRPGVSRPLPPPTYRVSTWNRPNGMEPVERFEDFRLQKQPWALMAMWPAMRLEIELHQRGWLPWNGIRESRIRLRGSHWQ